MSKWIFFEDKAYNLDSFTHVWIEKRNDGFIILGNKNGEHQTRLSPFYENLLECKQKFWKMFE